MQLIVKVLTTLSKDSDEYNGKVAGDNTGNTPV